MAGFRGHITFSSALGVAYGGLSWWQLNVDWPVAAVGGLLTAAAGMLPDIDSDSGIPMREISTSVSAIAPLVFIRRIAGLGLSPEEALLITIGIYCFVRFVFFRAIRRLSVHRGMFHSIPAMLIAGLATFLILDFPSMELRGFLAIGVMLGFLSHLVLDELCSVDLNGVIPKLNKFAGTAVKFWSPSLPATAFTYLFLGGLTYLAWNELPGHQPTKLEQQINVAQGPSANEEPRTKGPIRRVLGFRERPQTSEPLRWGPPAKKPDHVPMSIPGPRQ
jgi:membrane-bound metal-dependent hydrolase YbcI (DUF457 family)